MRGPSQQAASRGLAATLSIPTSRHAGRWRRPRRGTRRRQHADRVGQGSRNTAARERSAAEERRYQGEGGSAPGGGPEPGGQGEPAQGGVPVAGNGLGDPKSPRPKFGQGPGLGADGIPHPSCRSVAAAVGVVSHRRLVVVWGGGIPAGVVLGGGIPSGGGSGVGESQAAVVVCRRV